MLRILKERKHKKGINYMVFLAKTALFVLDIYFWVIIISVALSWLIAFEVVNVRNAKAANIVRLFEKLTEPVYRPIRKYIPAIGGIDVSPIIVIFAIYLLSGFFAQFAYHVYR